MERSKIIEVLKEAKETIKTWHNMGQEEENIKGTMWDIYNRNSPEMKRLNAMIELLEQQPAEELYEKVYIRSEEDLPQKEGAFYAYLKEDEMCYLDYEYNNNLPTEDKKYWLLEVEYYLRPLE